MAKRTGTKPEVGAPPPIGPPGPWPAPPEEHRSLLGWAALAFVVVVALAGGGWFVLGQRTRHHQPTPGNSASAPSTAGTPSLPAPVPATTYEAFAAMSTDQQQAVMQAVFDRDNAVWEEAVRTLNLSLLPQIATGDELGVLQRALQTVIKNGYPVAATNQTTILQVVMSPQPLSFVSVHVQVAATDQYLDPKTLQPIGTPDPSSGTSSFSFVIQDGTWKESEHIQDVTK